MARKAQKNVVRTSDGGTMTFMPSQKGLGGTIVIERGYKETPEERRERMKYASQARRFTPGNRKHKGGRSGARRAAIRDAA